MPALCRDCLTEFETGPRCPGCASPRVLAHPELKTLSIAHIDCDAFYASVEKRDNPELRDKPVIIGGGKRGVVSTACYVARIHGVRSAMPMFKALKLCPQAVVVRPRMQLYVDVSRAIKSLMQELTPLVEPLSLDEAFLDLTGTERLHGASPILSIIRLLRRIETDIGITASAGLSHNKFLAKIASDLDKPRGVSIIGKAETDIFLRQQKVGIIWGVGRAFQAKLHGDGIETIADICRYEETELMKRYGTMGSHIWRLAHGMDGRRVSSTSKAKSISNETTFNEDLSDLEILDGYLWRLALKVSDRLKAKDIAGQTVTLKLKRDDFKGITRQVRLHAPTQMTDIIYREARTLLEREKSKGPYRLIGIGLSHLTPVAEDTDPADLLDPMRPQRHAAERARDTIRARFGSDAIITGRSLR